MVTLADTRLGKVFKGKTVLVTGHTGFKGGWLSIWLNELGAKVVGYSLDLPTEPNLFTLAKLKDKLVDIRGDVRDVDHLTKVVQQYKPEFIFHLAAQAIVLTSYQNPRETFDINVGGTVNVLEAARHSDSVKAIVCVTSDKCYKDQHSIHGYRETDTLGGRDPYSASKALAELAIASYRDSFFTPEKKTQTLVASVRAGNVVGGGDFAPYRLVPDCIHALLNNKPVEVRNPSSIRPWQHVLVPLSGYLWLAVQLYEGEREYADAWNFGPPEMHGVSTQELVEQLLNEWGNGTWNHTPIANAPKETGMLRLSWEKAAHALRWDPIYGWREMVKDATQWSKEYARQQTEGQIDMYSSCVSSIETFTSKALITKTPWALG